MPPFLARREACSRRGTELCRYEALNGIDADVTGPVYGLIAPRATIREMRPTVAAGREIGAVHEREFRASRAKVGLIADAGAGIRTDAVPAAIVHGRAITAEPGADASGTDHIVRAGPTDCSIAATRCGGLTGERNAGSALATAIAGGWIAEATAVDAVLAGRALDRAGATGGVAVQVCLTAGGRVAVAIGEARITDAAALGAVHVGSAGVTAAGAVALVATRDALPTAEVVAGVTLDAAARPVAGRLALRNRGAGSA